MEKDTIDKKEIEFMLNHEEKLEENMVNSLINRFGHKLSKQEQLELKKDKEFSDLCDTLDTFFFDSFTKKDDFQNKRFGRYVDKTKEFLFRNLTELFYEMEEDLNLEEALGSILLRKYIYDFFDAMITVIEPLVDLCPDAEYICDLPLSIFVGNMDIVNLFVIARMPIDQIKEDLKEYLEREKEENEVEEKDNYCAIKIDTFLELAKAAIEYKEDFCNLFPTYSYNFPEEVRINNLGTKLEFLLEGGSVHNTTFAEMIDKEMVEVCLNYIRTKAMFTTDDVNFSNYFSFTKPLNGKDFLLLIQDILNRLYVNIEILFDNVFVNAYSKEISKIVSETFENTDEDLEEQMEELEDENKELRHYVYELEQTIKQQKQQIEEMENDFSKKQAKVVKESNKELENKLDFLNKKYNELREEKNKLEKEFEYYKKSNVNGNDNANFLENKMLEPNISIPTYNEEEIAKGKYLFVINEKASYVPNMKEFFENSTFTDNLEYIYNLDLTNYDVVVFMVSHLDHTTYYGAKNTCKKSNVPHIIITFSNFSRIVKELANCLENNKK